MEYFLGVREELEDGVYITREDYKLDVEYNDIFKPFLGQNIDEYLDGKKLIDTQDIFSDIIKNLDSGADAGKNAAQDLLNLCISYPNCYWVIE